MASPPSPLKGKTLLLGLTGSIAVYKSCDLVRRLKDRGADVFCLMTRSAKEFVSPLTFSALSGNTVACEIWDESLWKMAHLEFAEMADLYLISPASSNCLARLAAGMADDVVTATALACRKTPILIAPAMHEGMWLHPATQRNVKILKGFGARFIGPEHGVLARGNKGWGRLADAARIIAEAEKILSRRG